MDEAVLIDQLRRGVSAPPARPDLGALRARTTHRRRRRRTAGAAVAVVLGLLGVAAVASGRGGPASSTHVVATAPPTTVPAEPAPTRPLTFTIERVPDSMDAEACGLVDPRADLRSCGLTTPGAALPADVHLAFTPGSASAALREAWDRRDATEAARLLGWGSSAGPRFVELGGVRALGFGETERVDGSSLGLPDRVAIGYAVLVGDTVVQVNAEAGASALPDVVRGLALTPRWSALDGVLERLPSDAVVVAQGVRSRWGRVDLAHPGQATAPPVTSYGADIVVPSAARRGLTVEVVEGLDVRAFLSGLRSVAGTPYPVTRFEGHRAVRIARSSAPNEAHGLAPDTPIVPRSGDELLVEVDDDTLLVVAATPQLVLQMESAAQRVLANIG